MGENQESMTVDEFLERSRGIRIVGRLEAVEGTSRVKLTLVSSGAIACCQKSITMSRDAIQEVRRMGEGARVVEVVLKDDATFSASEVFGEHGVVTCQCGEGAMTARMANSATTTVDRCRACGCVYDGLSCRCGSPSTADCASRPYAAWPYVIAVRYAE